MKRKVIDDLILWKNSNSGKPFLLTGAKGVGKTYVAYDFAKAFFERIFYINFERETEASNLFQSSDRNEFLDRLFAYLKVEKDSLSESRIIILDELILNQKTVNLILSLKESGIFPNIITISSNPVSELIKVLFCHKQVFPLEFDEFLLATGNEWYIEAIMTHYETNKKIPEIVHKELLALHQEYLQIGGMPGSINEYLSLSSLVNVPEQHCLLISAYHDYILRDNQESEALKMNQVYDSLPFQLLKENKKFQYKLIRKGTTHSMYKDAIQKLADCDYIIQCNKITAGQLNSVANPDNFDYFSKDEANTNFKLFLSDTGLLNTKLAEVKGEALNDDITKALLENFVAQSLHNKGYQLAFWESDSMAKIDFLIKKDNEFLPIEIHINDNTRSKSINVFKQKCNFPYAVKISSKNFEYSNQIKYVPYYAVFCL